MGSPAELTLNCRPSSTSSSSVFKGISLLGDQFERMRRHEEYLKGLEEERRKIDAFKRELPFCMQLLNDAIEASKEQLADCQQSPFYEDEQNAPNSNDRPVLEEFIPMKKTSEETDSKSEEKHGVTKAANGGKPNWMISAQLWNQNSEIADSRKERPLSLEEPSKQQDTHQQQSFPSNPKLFLDSKHRVGGAFHPFLKERQVINPLPVRSTAERALPNLTLPSGEQEVGSSYRCNENPSLNATSTSRSRSREPTEAPAPVQEKEAVAVTNGTSSSPTTSTPNAAQPQSQRKSRRCWSPELHRRFVNALQQLGGSQVATPKQIRELMKVDGLTNDEVKSHLQKYRLHTRRPSPSPQSTNPQAPQLVVLGGIWVPPEYAAAAAQQGQTLYNPLSSTAASQSQSPYCQPSLPQEFYSQMNPSSQLQLHPSLYCDQQQTPSHSQTSPQGPLQCNGQSSGARGTSGDGGREESVGEDGKSDSSSWKGEEYTETTELRNMGRGLSLRKETRQFMDDDDGDTEDNRGRAQIGKAKKTQMLGR
eukprot:Gb_23423 [translate_table: standard]